MKDVKIVMPKLSVITPTIGEKYLQNLQASLIRQDKNIDINHIVLWNNYVIKERESDPVAGTTFISDNVSVTNIILPFMFNNGEAKGSSLRAVGLMIANSEYVTFADSDIMFEENHFSTMLDAIKDKNWAYSKRKIWSKFSENQFEYLGVDNFESVGEEAKTPYKMIDNSSMIFKRRFGSSAAPLYREITTYSDDREFYQFLMKYAGEPGKTNLATVNQICPDKLIEFFRQNCTR